MTTPDLKRLLELAEKITPGDWFQWTCDGDVSAYSLDALIFQSKLRDAEGNATEEGLANCEFVCHARNLAPKLAKDKLSIREILAANLQSALTAIDDDATVVTGGFPIDLRITYTEARELLGLLGD